MENKFRITKLERVIEYTYHWSVEQYYHTWRGRCYPKIRGWSVRGLFKTRADARIFHRVLKYAL